MKIALFADIHGKILLPFKLVDLYQKQTGHKIDFILQCGDMGAYPKLENLDKATLKHAKADRDELGFYDDFTKPNPEIKTFLEELNLDMICVRGNHEDHEFLNAIEQNNSLENRFPIDVYNRVFVCKSGKKQLLQKDNETLSFVGIGRIGDRKNRSEQRFIQDYEKKEIKKLIKSNEQFDVLITHDKDDGSQRGYGMTEIRNVLDELIFQYHFYGHTGEAFHQELDVNGITKSVKIKELEFNTGGVLEYGSMLILTKVDDEISLEIVSQEITNQLTKFNWKL